MKKHATTRWRVLAALAACAALALSWHAGAAGTASARPAFAECEGDACAQVALAFDGEKGFYLARNNSADRWVRVTASNLAASATACLGPGRAEYLPLKSVTGAYRAEYSEPKCGSGI